MNIHQSLELSEENFKKIIDIINSFKIKENIFVIKLNKKKLTLTSYPSKNKILFQGEYDEDFEKILNINISQFQEPVRLTTLDITHNKESSFEYIVGLDETGKGEAGGSLFTCGVLIKNEDLNDLSIILPKCDIKTLNETKVLSIFNSIKSKKLLSLIREMKGCEIDYFRTERTMNAILDDMYIDILKNLTKNISPKKTLIVLDDYKIASNFSLFKKELESKGFTFIIEEKADTNYISSKSAAIIAKVERIDQVKKLNNECGIVYDDKSYFPGKLANNEDFYNYIHAYLKKNKTLGLPSFVRTSWNNIQEIINQYPRSKQDINLLCPFCGNICKCLFIHMIHDNLNTKIDGLFCEKCRNEISNCIPKLIFESVLCDTCSLVSKIVSKDKHNYCLFKNKKLLLTGALLIEINSLKTSKAIAANEEIKLIKELSTKGYLEVINAPYEVRRYNQNDPNQFDDFFIEKTCIENNCIFVTQDKLAAKKATAKGVFCFFITPYDVDIKKYNF